MAYVVFGIMYLVQDYHVANDCAGSSLWAYVLVAIIMAYSRLQAGKNAQADMDGGKGGAEIAAGLCCYLLLEAGLAVWGGVELYDNACHDLQQTRLWQFGLATFAIQIASASLIVLVQLCMCVVMAAQTPAPATQTSLRQTNPNYSTSV